MITSMKNWVTAIAAAGMFLALFDSITPRNTAGRFATLCGSLLLTLVVISPVINGGVSVGKYSFPDYREELNEYVGKVLDENEKLESIIIDNTGSE